MGSLRTLRVKVLHMGATIFRSSLVIKYGDPACTTIAPPTNLCKTLKGWGTLAFHP